MIRLEEEINKLKKMLFEMASSAEEMIAKSIKALQENNMILAEEIIKSDDKVNEMEIEIDNQCIRILALFHPEAEDLRTVTMIMKINNDLERIGDHAVNIAEKVIYLADKPPVKPLIDIPKMAEKAIEMLQESLDSFVNKDAELAIQVCKKDDEVIVSPVTDPGSIAAVICNGLKLVVVDSEENTYPLLVLTSPSKKLQCSRNVIDC